MPLVEIPFNLFLRNSFLNQNVQLSKKSTTKKDNKNKFLYTDIIFIVYQSINSKSKSILIIFFITTLKARISTSSFQIATLMTKIVTIIAVKKLAILITTAILIITQRSQ